MKSENAEDIRRIGAVSNALAAHARELGLETLAYVLDQASFEAEDAMRRVQSYLKHDHQSQSAHH